MSNVYRLVPGHGCVPMDEDEVHREAHLARQRAKQAARKAARKGVLRHDHEAEAEWWDKRGWEFPDVSDFD